MTDSEGRFQPVRSKSVTEYDAEGRVTASYIHDEHDRATRVEVRDADGTIVNRAERTLMRKDALSKKNKFWTISRR